MEIHWVLGTDKFCPDPVNCRAGVEQFPFCSLQTIFTPDQTWDEMNTILPKNCGLLSYLTCRDITEDFSGEINVQRIVGTRS